MEAHVPALADLKAAVHELLPLVGFQRCSVHDFRRKLEERLELTAGSLDPRACEVNTMLQEALQGAMVEKASAAQKSLADDLGVEDSSQAKRTYLVTLPHTTEEASTDGHKLFPPNRYTPAQIGASFLAALAQGARLQPLAFLLLSVFVERHSGVTVGRPTTMLPRWRTGASGLCR